MFGKNAKLARFAGMLYVFISTSFTGLCQFGSNGGGIGASPLSPKPMSAADSAWMDFPNPTFEGLVRGREVESFIKEEEFRVAYRKAGLKFWKKFPDDNRKYDWLARTILLAPKYWTDVQSSAISRAKGKYGPFEIDQKALLNWEKVYPFLRKEYLNTNKKSFLEKAEFKRLELEAYLYSTLNSKYRNDQKLDLKKTSSLFSAATNDYYKYKNDSLLGHQLQNPLRNIDVIFRHADFYGLTEEDFISFLNFYKSDPNQEVREWVEGKFSSLALKRNPISFKGMTTLGKTIDIKDFRGKVVLLDFWATWCSSCIARMPAIKKVYDKYKDQGFEVISIAIDPISYQDKVEAVEHKIGADWPVMLIGGKDAKDMPNSLFNKIWKQYGFTSVPQLLLLDQDGLTVAINGLLYNGDFEPLVRKLLTKQ